MTALSDAVAKAICAADFHDWPEDDYNGRTQRKAYLKMAGAAIAAIIAEGYQITKKPTPEPPLFETRQVGEGTVTLHKAFRK